jgi:hypothetical protein
VIARLPQSTLRVRAFDSQEMAGENGRAVNVLDANNATFWHTQWSGAAPPHPHTPTSAHAHGELPARQNLNYGRIARYEFARRRTAPKLGHAAAGTWPDGIA